MQSPEIALQLQIVRRICEHKIDARGGQATEFGDAIAGYDLIDNSRYKTDAGRPYGRPATRHNHDSEL